MMSDDEDACTTTTKEESTFVDLDPALSSVEWKDGLYPVEVHIAGEITSDSALAFETSFREAVMSGQEAIAVVLHSEGGCLYSAMRCVDLMALAPEHIKVYTVVRGMAMSAAAMIFCAGDERIMGPNASLMMHSASTTIFGKSGDLEVESKEVKRLTDGMVKIMADGTGVKKSFFEKKLAKNVDYYISPDEALKMGICTFVGDIRLTTKITTVTTADLIEPRKKKRRKV